MWSKALPMKMYTYVMKNIKFLTSISDLLIPGQASLCSNAN